MNEIMNVHRAEIGNGTLCLLIDILTRLTFNAWEVDYLRRWSGTNNTTTSDGQLTKKIVM